VPVEDAGALNRLLGVAMPEGELRPGDPVVRAWYGIWDGGDLVACAADRSSRIDDPAVEVVGVIGSVAVDPRQRRRGLGAAITAALTGLLRHRYDLVTLGVMAGNDAAARIYQRLGFSDVIPVTSLWVGRQQPEHTRE
jgi:predicted GNAT family acetyltransferase